MRLLKSSRRRKSSATLSATFADSASLYSSCQRETQEGTLALPTKLDEVAGSVHDSVPQQLPPEQASEDDVRYFLYQILTLKDYNLARKHPQWVLETCMLWQGDAGKLRSLPLESFNQLCPLRPGHAAIDWAVKSSKFEKQLLPPCGIRDEIGQRVKNIVEGLKRKEQGLRGPGWQNAPDVKPGPAPSTVIMANAPSPMDPQFQMSPFQTSTAYPVPNHFYGVGNQSLPVLQQMPQSSTHLNLPLLKRQPSLPVLQYGDSSTEPLRRFFDSPSKLSLPLSPACRIQGSHISSARTPLSSYGRRTPSISSRFTASTAPTSPASSESEHPYGARTLGRRTSVRSTATSSQSSSPGLYHSSIQRTSTATPSRYRKMHSETHINDRPFHPVHHMAQLRSPSFTVHSPYAPSDASLAPSDSATDMYSLRCTPVVPSQTVQQSLRHRPSFSSTPVSSVSGFSTSPVALAAGSEYVQGRTPSCAGTVKSYARAQDGQARPVNNYKVDSHALDSAEHVGRKFMPGPIRSMVANNEERQRHITRMKSDAGLSMRTEGMVNSIPSRAEPVGPLLRFQNPRTGQPRLTIYETIEQHARLGKQPLEDQRRLDMQRGTLKTVFETIEEQELLDGKPQRGMDNCVKSGWSKFF